MLNLMKILQLINKFWKLKILFNNYFKFYIIFFFFYKQ